MGEPISEGEGEAKAKTDKYICPECGRVYADPKSLGAHLVRKHGYAPIPPPPPMVGSQYMAVSNVSIDGAFRRGYAEGYVEGYNVGKTEGYQKGYRDGHAIGRVEGWEEGYEDGYADAGYDKSDKEVKE